MGLINHVTRRQATYVWRRRVPAAAGTGSLQVSLCTTAPRAARRIATIVTLRSDAVFEDMMERRLTRAEAKALLDGVVRWARKVLEANDSMVRAMVHERSGTLMRWTGTGPASSALQTRSPNTLM